MANCKKGQNETWKKLSSSCDRENYDGDSDGSIDEDWLTARKQKRAKRLKERSRDFARESGKNWRNFNSKGNGGGSWRKKHGLGEDEDSQCYWIECLNVARRGSKYCSDECGIKLADRRIRMLLPERLRDWQSTQSIAEKNNRKELEEIKEQLAKLSNHFWELEEKRQILDEYIDEVSKICRESIIDESDESELGEDAAVGCVSCGHETSTKNYVKHVDRCFIKMEKQVEFDGKIPTHLPGTRLFCNINTKGSYCRRLAVNCPDHSKRDHFAKNAVCGAPLPNGVKGELNLNNICTTLKSKCLRHYNWEKFHRAEIDTQKVECWTSQLQMVVKQKKITQQMSNRGGLLNLLMHSTKKEDNPESLSGNQIDTTSVLF